MREQDGAAQLDAVEQSCMCMQTCDGHAVDSFAMYACPCMLADTITWEVQQTFQDDNKGPLAHRRTMTPQGVQAHRSRGECLYHLLDFADLLEDQNLSSKDYRVTDQEPCLLVEQRVQLQELPPAPVLCRLAVAVLRLLRNSPGDSRSGFQPLSQPLKLRLTVG